MTETDIGRGLRVWDFLGRKFPNLKTDRSPVELPDCGRDDLAWWFNKLRFTEGVEVGTEYGEYAEVLCKANPQLHLTCVDPYTAYGDYRDHKSQDKLNAMFEQTQRRLFVYNVQFLRLFSTAAAANFKNNSLDFVYLDGNHSLPYVIADLQAWVPKVRKGGIIAGHDMIRRNNSLRYQCHVVEAVHAWTQAYMVNPWFILGSKDIVEGEKRDKIRSFMWIKT